MPGRLDPKPIPRRDFLGMAGLWTAGLAIVGSLLGMARLPKPRVTPEASSRFRVGKPQEFTSGSKKIISEYKVEIQSTPQGIAALSLVCTHLGCIVSQHENGYSCPCHGLKFDAAGAVIGGPAPRPLRWLAVSQAVDGSLVVDTSQEVQAGQYFKV